MRSTETYQTVANLELGRGGAGPDFGLFWVDILRRWKDCWCDRKVNACEYALLPLKNRCDCGCRIFRQDDGTEPRAKSSNSNPDLFTNQRVGLRGA